MPDGAKIDLAKLRALIVANTGEGKPWTRRKLSLAASGGRNPDLVRDIMRVDRRKPTLETATGICAALQVPLSEVIKGIGEPTEADEWITVCQSVQAGVWREQTEWPPDECYEARVGPPLVDGDRFGAVVDGKSMDKKLPPGTILECVRLIGSGIAPKSGDYVIVERAQGGLREVTCKRLSQRANGDWELIAESTQPEFREPIPIGHPDEGHWGDDETRIVAIVVRARLLLFDADRREAA